MADTPTLQPSPVAALGACYPEAKMQNKALNQGLLFSFIKDLFILIWEAELKGEDRSSIF